jgi:hypothetical protein
MVASKPPADNGLANIPQWSIDALEGKKPESCSNCTIAEMTSRVLAERLAEVASYLRCSADGDMLSSDAEYFLGWARSEVKRKMPRPCENCTRTTQYVDNYCFGHYGSEHCSYMPHDMNLLVNTEVSDE